MKRKKSKRKTSKWRAARPDTRRAQLEELESRLLFSADGLGILIDGAPVRTEDLYTSPALVETLDRHVALQQEAAELIRSEMVFVNDASRHADRGADGRFFVVHHLAVESIEDAGVLNNRVASLALAPEDATMQGVDIVLVDRSLMNDQQLAGAALEDAQVIQYDGEKESSETVLGRVVGYATFTDQSIHSLSIMAHGREGAFKLGNTWIDAGDPSARTEAWSALDAVMHDGGNLYLFGCNVASDADAGQALLDGLSAATGADVFASNDLTGAGGDWELEAASTGAAEELRQGLDTPFDTAALADYGATLVDYNETGWSGSQVFTDGPTPLPWMWRAVALSTGPITALPTR